MHGNGAGPGLDAFEQLGRPDGILWEDWRWEPTDSGSSSAQVEADAERVVAQDDGEEDQQAGVERQREADAAAAAEAAAAAAEQKRLKQLADDKAERDRLAAEKAKQQQASTDTDANRCVTTPELRQNDTFQGNTAAYVTNGCDTPVDVRICLMRDTQGWNCGMTYTLAPQKSWSWSSMHATGQVFMDARVSTSNRQMASPQ